MDRVLPLSEKMKIQGLIKKKGGVYVKVFKV